MKSLTQAVPLVGGRAWIWSLVPVSRMQVAQPSPLWQWMFFIQPLPKSSAMTASWQIFHRRIEQEISIMKALSHNFIPVLFIVAWPCTLILIKPSYDSLRAPRASLGSFYPNLLLYIY